MTALDLRPADECEWDLVSFGEIMLRLDPGEGRVRTTRSFNAWEGGGEYNVARGLRRCFGLKTAVATSFVENEVRLLGELVSRIGATPTGSTLKQRYREMMQKSMRRYMGVLG